MNRDNNVRFLFDLNNFRKIFIRTYILVIVLLSNILLSNQLINIKFTNRILLKHIKIQIV